VATHQCFSCFLHSTGDAFTGCTQAAFVSHLQEAGALVQSQIRHSQKDRRRRLKLIKTAAEVCPLCEGTGWKTLSASGGSPRNTNRNTSSNKDRRVTRCDCQLRARAATLLAAARIPKRYEHCELASYTTDFPGAHPSLAFAYVSAAKFAQEYDPRAGTGLLVIGKIGTGKTHLAVAIIKELILNKEFI